MVGRVKSRSSGRQQGRIHSSQVLRDAGRPNRHMRLAGAQEIINFEGRCTVIEVNKDIEVGNQACREVDMEKSY